VLATRDECKPNRLKTRTHARHDRIKSPGTTQLDVTVHTGRAHETAKHVQPAPWVERDKSSLRSSRISCSSRCDGALSGTLWHALSCELIGLSPSLCCGARASARARHTMHRTILTPYARTDPPAGHVRTALGAAAGHSSGGSQTALSTAQAAATAPQAPLPAAATSGAAAQEAQAVGTRRSSASMRCAGAR
jgi:hypothetical protein